MQLKLSRSVSSALLASLAALSGCATYYDVQFLPTPLEVKLEDAATPGLAGRALISVIGVRQPHRDDNPTAQFELAMRFENAGTVPFMLESSSLELLTADLQSVGAARVAPEAGAGVGPGETVNYQVVFPLAGDRKLTQYDVSGLNLRWALLFQGRRMVTGVTFQGVLPPRAYYYHYDPYWGAYPYWCGSVHVGHFRRY